MNKRVAIFIIVAYLFSLFFRFFLYFSASHNPEFLYNHHIISLWTADAGLYGHYAKVLLQGGSVPNDPDTALGYLIYWVVKYVGLDIDWVIFTIAAFLASLLVVPIILIGYELGVLEVGFWAALAASVGMNYYFRTHMGYTDTDSLNFVFFFTLLYGYIALLKRSSFWFALIIALVNLLFLHWYHSAKPLTFGLWLFFVVVVLLIDRKNVQALLGSLVVLLSFLPLALPYLLGSIVVASAIGWFVTKRWHIDHRYVLTLFLAGAIVGGWYGYRHNVFDRAVAYLDKRSAYTLIDKNHKKIELEATLKTVAEARGITPKQLFTYSSGGVIIFLLGTIGLVLLIWRQRAGLMLLLPYLIGIVSLWGGVRFTTFAVPVIAMGFVYLFHLFFERFRSRRFAPLIFYAPALFLVGYYLNIMAGYNQMLSPFFKRGELRAIEEKLDKPDRGYIVTWWDYGWPLWFYTNKRTIIDNGKHHYDNYIVAKTLFSYDQEFVANFDRYFIERYDRIYPWAILPYVIKRTPLQEILKECYEGTIELPPKKNAIYYYFDDKILTKLPVIESFSYLKGEKRRGFVWITKLRSYDPKKGVLRGEGVRIDLKRGLLVTAQGKDAIGTIYVHDGRRVVESLRFRRNNYALILYKSRYIIGAYRYINSFFFQAFFFNRLDPSLFETVHYDKDAKIFRLIGR